MTRLYNCPWQNRPTHARNNKIEVAADMPLAYGYCPQDNDCAYCAGTGYKPNVALQLGRNSRFIPCPYCEQDAYRRSVKQILKQMGK